MFDDLLDPATCGEISAAAMVSAIRQYNRREATSAARKWAFIAMLLRYRESVAAAEEQTWAHDTWTAVKDDIGAAMGLSPRRASGQIKLAEALAERLPKVAELLEFGHISAKMAATIVYRTEWVAVEAQPAVDAEIAARAGGLGSLSDTDIDLTIDAVIEERDPDACRRFREAAKGCDVGFGKLDDATGTRSLFGRIMATDAEVATQVLNAMADTVCKGDPRSRGQLRVAAFGAYFQGQDRLVCHCANPDCTAASIPSKVSRIVVHVLAEQATIDAALTEAAAYDDHQRTERARQQSQQADVPEPATTTTEDGAEDGEPWWATWTSAAPATTADTQADETTAPDTQKRQAECAAPTQPRSDSTQTDETDETDETDSDTEQSTAAATPEPTPDPPPTPSDTKAPSPTRSAHCRTPVPQPSEPHVAQPYIALTRPPVRAAVTTDGTVIPTPLLAEVIRTGATLTRLKTPAETPEGQYKPSRRLRRFVICRDLRCRFPGCNRRAEYGDIDHTIPDADGGPTHPSNTKTLCREHHLAKTFRGGPAGWRDEQLPDGGVIWTAPTGHSYLTEPTSIQIFPDWDTTTATLPPPTPKKRRPITNPGPTMPKRKRTRRQDREQRIKAERKYNATQRALEDGRGPPSPSPFD